MTAQAFSFVRELCGRLGLWWEPGERGGVRGASGRGEKGVTKGGEIADDKATQSQKYTMVTRAGSRSRTGRVVLCLVS